MKSMLAEWDQLKQELQQCYTTHLYVLRVPYVSCGTMEAMVAVETTLDVQPTTAVSSL